MADEHVLVRIDREEWFPCPDVHEATDKRDKHNLRTLTRDQFAHVTALVSEAEAKIKEAWDYLESIGAWNMEKDR